MNNPTPEFSRTVSLDSIGDKGTAQTITASKDECCQLAKRFELVSLESLTAEVRLTLEKGGRLIRLLGTFQAKIIQICGVTLEPIESDIEGALERLYDTEAEEAPISPKGTSEDLEPLSSDPPEPATDGVIDIGEAVSEQLSLEIDPFPRKQGIEFADYSTGPERGEAKATGDNEEKSSPSGPFAALEKLNREPK